MLLLHPFCDNVDQPSQALNRILKVDMTHMEVREVLQNQMDLKTRMVGVSDKSRMLGQMVGRMIVLSTVSRSGVCQSLMIGEIFLAIPTSATMLV